MKKMILACIVLAQASLLPAQNFDWAYSFHPLSSLTFAPEGSALATDKQGNVYHAGQFHDTVDMDPGIGVSNLISEYGVNCAYISKHDANGNLIWTKQTRSTIAFGSMGEFINDIAIDTSGNVYCTGSFRGTPDFDPGPGVVTFSAVFSDCFLLKLDPAGNFLWAKQFSGSSNDVGTALATDQSGNVYLTGSFANTFDIDPGPGTLNFTAASASFSDIFICKLDPSGNLLWAKQQGGIKADYTNSMVLDINGNLLLTGVFGSTCDFDPGAGTYNLTSAGGTDIFVCKLDAAGDLVWARSMGSTSGDLGNSIATDALGNIFTAGTFAGTVDFDPGAGTYNLIATGATVDVYFAKLTAAGNFVWARVLNGTSFDDVKEISVDTAANVYATGTFAGVTDFDPGSGTVNITPVGNKDLFVLKLDSTGGFKWAHGFGGTDHEESYAIEVDKWNNIYLLSAFTGTVDFDPTASTSNLVSVEDQNLSFVKWNQDYCSDINIYIDSATAITCAANGYASAFTLNGAAPYFYSWNTSPLTNDSIAAFSSSGIYTVTVTDANACVRTAAVLINAPDPMGGFDLDVNLIASSFRPGFSSTVLVDGFNNGCVPVSGQLKVLFDSQLTYTAASPLPDAISGDTLIWNFASLTHDAPHLVPVITFDTDIMAAMGDHVCFDVWITPASGDADASNNTKNYCFPVINAYDPNMKQVYPAGACNAGYILNDQRLTYTIHFQNTGTASATNVYVLDTLDSHLDLSSLVVTANSHSMITEILPGHIAKFRFDNIMLPDSNSNEALSHGFVVFDILLQPSIASGTPVRNGSAIYFDFNAPVLTNHVSNTVVDEVPVFASTQNPTVCAGDSVMVGDTWFKEEGLYTIDLLTAGGCDSTITLQLDVDTINAAVNQSGPMLTAVLPGASYQWIDCNNAGLPIAGEVAQTFSPVANGNYAVVVHNGTCSDTSACFNVTSLGVSGYVYSNTISLFPNPGKGHVYFKSTRDFSNAQLKLMDVTGQVLLQKNIGNTASFSIDMTEEAEGIYFFEITDGGSVSRLKFVKN